VLHDDQLVRFDDACVTGAGRNRLGVAALVQVLVQRAPGVAAASSERDARAFFVWRASDPASGKREEYRHPAVHDQFDRHHEPGDEARPLDAPAARDTAAAGAPERASEGRGSAAEASGSAAQAPQHGR
jgi:hypothetical protein